MYSGDDREATVSDFHLVAAALRQDAADVAAYAAVLTGTLADVLPPGCVTVERVRSVADRMRGRDGHVGRVIVRLGERTLVLSAGPVAEVHHEVRGVVLSRERVPLDAWVDLLAQGLVSYAEASARAAEALRRLVE
jgi:hypothetical protein